MIKHVIEFRSGNFFQNLKASHGGSLTTAQTFNSIEEAEKFMDDHYWILVQGGLVLEIESTQKTHG